MQPRPTHADLFTGIGGFALAAGWAGFVTRVFCEIDPFCQQLIRKRFLADTQRAGRHGTPQPGSTSGGLGKGWMLQPERRDSPPVLVPDIRDLDGRDFHGVDLLTGGFPCQPFSHAGLRRGAEDDRHLWPEMRRVIGEARPSFILAENVTGIITMELDEVLSDLEGIGYSCGTLVVPACGVDAPHRRNRVWIIGHTEHLGFVASKPRHGTQGETGWQEDLFQFEGAGAPPRALSYPAQRQNDQRERRIVDASTGAGQGGDTAAQPGGETLADPTGGRCRQCEPEPETTKHAGEGGQREDMAHPHEQGMEGCADARDLGGGRPQRDQLPGRRGGPCTWVDESRWFTQSGMGRISYGVSHRVDRLRSLGNAVVPQLAYEILKPIYELCCNKSIDTPESPCNSTR